MIFLKKFSYSFSVVILSLMVSCSSDNVEANNGAVFVQKTEKGYRLIRNNKPFVIKGASGNAFFEELREAGASTIRIYDTTNLSHYLNMADSLGLAIVADIPIPRFFEPDTVYSCNEKVRTINKSVKTFVNKHKKHPALLYWILGNELKYPDFPGNNKFYQSFNDLIAMIHEIDPNHPVSTAVGGFDRSRILSMQTKSEGLDFVSINIFGELSTFGKRKNQIELIWDGPYVFSEFGINGPWEAEKTTWMAPIEETSTKKAEQFRNRYTEYINTMEDGRLLGSLGFYWGHKQERTHTWFSLFSEMGKKTQTVFEMESLWKGLDRTFRGPKINYLLLNGKGSRENIVLSVNELNHAELLFLDDLVIDSLKTSWEIRPENWNYGFDEVETKPDIIEGLFLGMERTDCSFTAPSKEGPYRLYVKVEGPDSYFATANVPFYVLDPENGQ